MDWRIHRLFRIETSLRVFPVWYLSPDIEYLDPKRKAPNGGDATRLHQAFRSALAERPAGRDGKQQGEPMHAELLRMLCGPAAIPELRYLAAVTGTASILANGSHSCAGGAAAETWTRQGHPQGLVTQGVAGKSRAELGDWLKGQFTQFGGAEGERPMGSLLGAWPFAEFLATAVFDTPSSAADRSAQPWGAAGLDGGGMKMSEWAPWGVVSMKTGKSETAVRRDVLEDRILEDFLEVQVREMVGNPTNQDNRERLDGVTDLAEATHVQNALNQIFVNLLTTSSPATARVLANSWAGIQVPGVTPDHPGRRPDRLGLRRRLPDRHGDGAQ